MIFLENLDELFQRQKVVFKGVLRFSLLAKLVWADRLHHFLDERRV